MVSIRRRTDADVEACISALRVLYESENYPQGANRDLNYFLTNEKNQQAWVAEVNDEIVGHVSTSRIAHDPAMDLWKSLHPNDADSISLLSRLFVLPEYRKLGAGVKLMDAAVESNKKESNHLLLGVMANREAAIRLYDRLGWIRYGTTTYSLAMARKRTRFVSRVPHQNETKLRRGKLFTVSFITTEPATVIINN